MKVDDPAASPPEPAKAPERKRADANSFSKLLGQKAEVAQKKKKADEGVQFPSSDRESSASIPASAFVLPAQHQPAIVSQAPVVMHGEAEDIEGLIQEILLVCKPDGHPSIEIQFSSKTLEGLRVHISQEQDEVAIRFSAASALLSELISSNLDQLSDNLHSRGLQVAPIEVELAPAPIDSGPSRAAPRHGRRGRGSEREQREQK